MRTALIQSATFDKLEEVILSDAGQDIASAVDGKVGAPRQCKIEIHESWMLVAKLNIPKLIWRNGGLMENVEVLQLHNRWLHLRLKLLILIRLMV